jgi:mono/diheme cytochrome c family protein
MSGARRVAIPVAAGLLAAAVAFVVVLLATRGDASPARSSTPTPAAVAAGKPDPAGGRLVFARMGCGGCHRLAAAGSSGQIGPVLDQALPNHTRQSLAAKIRSPGQGSIMPGDFAQRMSFAEMQALIDFLIAARDAGSGGSGSQ